MAHGGEDFDIDPVDDFQEEEDEDDRVASAILDSMIYSDDERNAPSLQRELMESKVDSFYDSVGEEPVVKDYNQFEMDKGGHLFVNTDRGKIRLTHKRDPAKFRALNTLRTEVGSDSGLLRYLGVGGRQLPRKLATTLQDLQTQLPTGQDIEMTEVKQLVGVADRAVQESSFTEHQIDEAMRTIEESPLHAASGLPMREILGLNKALQTIRGELTNNVAKLSELDADIEREKKNLARADEQNYGIAVKERIQQRLRDLQLERSARLEVITIGRNKLSTQVNRIKQTIQKILHEDTTLGERLKTLFREQGITIASVITALGLIISTVVTAVTGGGGGGVTPPSPPSDPKDLKSWVKKQLTHLSDLLKKLAVKAFATLPGIIGSIISFLLTTAGNVFLFMAEHVWLFLVALVGLIVGYLVKQVKQKYSKGS